MSAAQTSVRTNGDAFKFGLTTPKLNGGSVKSGEVVYEPVGFVILGGVDVTR